MFGPLRRFVQACLSLGDFTYFWWNRIGMLSHRFSILIVPIPGEKGVTTTVVTESSTSPWTSTVRACSWGIRRTVVCDELKLNGCEITFDMVGFKTIELDLTLGQNGLLYRRNHKNVILDLHGVEICLRRCLLRDCCSENNPQLLLFT